MKTGCQPPYCHGTGGFCGCNCKCCPPPCCPVIAVYFDCGSTQSPDNPQGCPPSVSLWEDLPLELPLPQDDLPDFFKGPIFSEDRKFTLGLGSIPCSIPCQTICVEIRCGGFDLPCCCLELLDGRIFSVGNGYVTANELTVEVPGCGTADVLINGLMPPVFVSDCEEIIVTLQLRDQTCCHCTNQIDVQCSPCTPRFSMAAVKAPLWKRKIDPRTGKTKLNPNTGKPIIVINKTELLKRVKKRVNQSKRRSKD